MKKTSMSVSRPSKAVATRPAALAALEAAAQSPVSGEVFALIVHGQAVELSGTRIIEEQTPFYTPEELHSGVVVQLLSGLILDTESPFENHFWNTAQLPHALPRRLYATYKLRQLLPTDETAVEKFYHIQEVASIPLEGRNDLRRFVVTALEPRQFGV